MLTATTVDSMILRASAVHADTCSFTLSALSPRQSLWDAIPRDIDSVRHFEEEQMQRYCAQLLNGAAMFHHNIRELLAQSKLMVIESIKQEVRGQRGRTNGLAQRAAQRFPFAPTHLVQQCLTFQMAVHDGALAAQQPRVERELVDAIMKRINVWWREQEARYGRLQVSLADKQLFATAAANAIMIENGTDAYGDVVLVSRDFNHVFRMYHYREDILRPVCNKMKLLYPRNFVFRPSFHTVGDTF